MLKFLTKNVDFFKTKIYNEIVKKIKDEDDLENISLYYFGDEETDGAMKTGATTVTLDGESYNFLFNKTGGAESKGKGLTGVDDNKYIYNFGCRIKANSDDKYQVVAVTPQYVNGPTDIHAPSVSVNKISSTTLKALTSSYTNNKGESVSFVNHPTILGWLDYNGIPEILETKLYLVNTSGNIQKSKVAAKDGDEWYFYVKDREVQLYTNNKELKSDEYKDWTDLLGAEDAEN